MRVAQKSYTMVCRHAWETIHSLKLVHYRIVQADKPWYNYYVTNWYNHAEYEAVIEEYVKLLTMITKRKMREQEFNAKSSVVLQQPL